MPSDGCAGTRAWRVAVVRRLLGAVCGAVWGLGVLEFGVLVIWLAGTARAADLGQAPVATGGSDGQGAVRQQLPDELEQFRRALSQPGPEAEAGRVQAISALLIRTEPAAHEILQEAVLRGDDADRTSRAILANLVLAVPGLGHPVFGVTEQRAALLPGWIRTFARLFVVDQETPAPPPGATALQSAARDVVRGLQITERQALLQQVSQSPELGLRRAALRLAGSSRDTHLAPWIAERLEDPELVEVAREALARLTFEPRGFTDRAAFDAWYERNSRLTYLELAERAALGLREDVERFQQEADAEVLEAVGRLVEALARATPPSWGALQTEVFREQPVGGTKVWLERLRDVLGPRVLGGAQLATVVPDRAPFATALATRLDAGQFPGERPILLEVLAYVVPATPPEAAERVQARLCAGLVDPDVAVRVASLRGMRRFPSAAHRAAVLDCVHAELARDEVDEEVVVAGLECLLTSGWAAPSAGDADLGSWIRLVHAALVTAGLSDLAHERALDLAIRRPVDGSVVVGLFPVLRDLVADPSVDPGLRKQALPKLVVFAHPVVGGEDLSDEYVEAVLARFADSDPGLRRLACEQLVTLPEDPGRVEEWSRSVLDAAARRYLVEDDARGAKALTDVVLARVGGPVPTRDVAEVFVRIAEQLVEVVDPATAESDVRRQAVVDGMRVLGADPSLERSAWARIGDGLATLRARDALRSLLGRQDAAAILDAPPAEIAGAVESILRLVLRCAALAPEPFDPILPERSDEAEQVMEAYRALSSHGVATTLAERLVYVEALGVIGQHAEAVRLSTEALQNPEQVPTPDQRIRYLTVLTHELVQSGALDAATQRFAELAATAGLESERILRVGLRLARARVDSGDPSAAVELLNRLLPACSSDSALWRATLLDRADARLALNDDTARITAANELRKFAERFVEPKAPEADRLRFQALLRRADGDG